MNAASHKATNLLKTHERYARTFIPAHQRSLVRVYFTCGPGQSFFQCGPGTPEGWTPLHGVSGGQGAPSPRAQGCRLPSQAKGHGSLCPVHGPSVITCPEPLLGSRRGVWSTEHRSPGHPQSPPTEVESRRTDTPRSNETCFSVAQSSPCRFLQIRPEKPCLLPRSKPCQGVPSHRAEASAPARGGGVRP